MKQGWLTLGVLAAMFLTHPMAAQTNATPCGEPPGVLRSTQPNIFSEQQEQWLGEAMADYAARDYPPVRDPALQTYLKDVGDRLLAVLPPTTLVFHYTLVESDEINGFSLAGGQVFLTRKLVASARSEDEIAGVIAHEMGHILSHQFAVETTADLRTLLGVTSVGDRADIFAKYQRLVDARQHQKHHAADGDSDDNQDGADRVAVYATAAAGYRVQAYAEFWDRSFFVGGKTGSRLSDLFGVTTPTQKRLRRIRGIIGELPPGCGSAAEAPASSAFQHWQLAVLEDQAPASGPGEDRTGALVASTGVPLRPPLRADLDRVRFSRDGRYILAQDESSIYVLQREPFRELFRMDAEDALPAEFTPDSSGIAFATRGLHVELWDLAAQKLLSAHEIVSPYDCIQTLLSPDARSLGCIHLRDTGQLNFALFDVGTGSIVYEDKLWFTPGPWLQNALALRRLTGDMSDLISSSLSADGNLLLLGPGSDRIALDLRSRTPIKLDGALKDSIYPVSYAFQGNDKVVMVNTSKAELSGVFSFPDGKRLSRNTLGLGYMQATTEGPYLLTSVPEAAVAIMDYVAGTFVFASHAPAADVFGDTVVNQNSDGTLGLIELRATADKTGRRASLSLSPLPFASAISLSPEGSYLALSTRNRAAVWDLRTGEQILQIRGLRYPVWTSGTTLLAEFPAVDKAHPRVMGEIDMRTRKERILGYKLPDDAPIEGGHVLEWKLDHRTYTLTASALSDLHVEWKREFTDSRPGYTTNDGDSDLIFSYPLTSPLVNEKVRANPALKTEAEAVKQKSTGRLIEIVASADGATRQSVVVQVPLTYRGVDGFNRVGDLLYLSTGDNRTVVYSLKNGAELRQAFGRLVAADALSGNICLVNRRNEAIILDAKGAELQHLTLNSPLRFADLREHGTKLMVLTADQQLRAFPVPQARIAAATLQ